MNEHFITINKKPDRLQKTAFNTMRRRRRRACLSAAYSELTHSARWEGE